MDWATDTDVELGLRLAVALENFWATHDAREGARRLKPLLERAEGVDLGLLIRAWRDYGGCHDVAGDVELARLAYERSGELSRLAGDERGVANSVFRVGVAAWVAGDLEQARRLHEESLEMFRRIEDPIGELQALGNLGWFEFEHGDPDRSREMVDKSLAMAREAGWIWWEATQLGGLAEAALQTDRFEEGERLARQVLAIGKDLEDRKQVVYALAMLAWAAAGRSDRDRAALLWAAVQAEEPGAGRFWVLDREQYAERLSDLPRAATVLPLEEAVEYALGESDA
jgi:tetratricopeptide (TPR) repeat protein